MSQETSCAQTAVMKQALEALEAYSRWAASMETEMQAHNAITALRAALAAPEPNVPTWQPIETAPRDGSEVLLHEIYERLPVIGWWSEKRKRWYASTEVYDTDGDATVIDKLYTEGVTHWMPLPAPPQTKEPINE